MKYVWKLLKNAIRRMVSMTYKFTRFRLKLNLKQTYSEVCEKSAEKPLINLIIWNFMGSNEFVDFYRLYCMSKKESLA